MIFNTEIDRQLVILTVRVASHAQELFIFFEVFKPQVVYATCISQWDSPLANNWFDLN